VARKSNLSLGSFVRFRNSARIEARGSLVRLSRQQVVFEVYNPYSIVQLSEVLTEVRIMQGERETYQGRAVVTGLLNTGLMLIVSASLVDPWSDLKGLVPGDILRSYVHDFVSDWDASVARLHSDFRLCVGNLRNYLQELSRWLEHWETEAGIRESSDKENFVLDFVGDVDAEIAPRLTDLYSQFEDASKEIDRKHEPFHRAYAQRELHPIMMCSPFMHRAFSKPLGYAGDFIMVQMMINRPWEGNNTFAKLLNASALRHEAPAAHRNRIDMLHQALRRETRLALSQYGTAKVLNIGCGPAEEVRRFIEEDGESSCTEFTLVDFNKETLEFVATNLLPFARQRRPEMIINTEQRSVHEIIQQSVEAKRSDAPEYDVVYCAGLFDYFRDTTCGFLLELFYSWIKPGGVVLVTNVSPTHSSIAIMRYVLEWNLELRDAAQMASLVPDLGVQNTYVDKTGVNVFLEIRKPKQ
jgi:extracellular factor (EF) 3-hydroxypalmitic acid methyl ester biosynthesis protein